MRLLQTHAFHRAYTSNIRQTELSCTTLCWFPWCAGKKSKILCSRWWRFLTATSAIAVLYELNFTALHFLQNDCNVTALAMLQLSLIYLNLKCIKVQQKVRHVPAPQRYVIMEFEQTLGSPTLVSIYLRAIFKRRYHLSALQTWLFKLLIMFCCCPFKFEARTGPYNNKSTL